MGIYVNYKLGEYDGIRSRFLDDIDAFAVWFRESAEEFPNDYPDGQLNKTLDFAQRGADAFCAATAAEANLIDRIVDEYWNYCSSEGLHRENDIGSWSHKWYRYAADLAEVLPDSSELARAYYRSLLRGRSLAECVGHEYRSEDEVFHISWLLPSEVVAFCAELEPFSPLLEQDTDEATGVRLMLRALRQAAGLGTSLIVVIA